MSRGETPARWLSALERVHRRYGGDAGRSKLALLGRLRDARLPSPAAVLRLHEVLCFLRAYPDDARVLARVEWLLAAFTRRADLRRHAQALADTGIAGTVIRYRFFWPTADWIAQHWPDQLYLDRDDTDAGERLAAALPLLVEPVAADWLRVAKPGGFAALDRLRTAAITDAAWLLGLVASMSGDEFTREAFADAIDAGYLLRPGRGTPSRTLAIAPGAPRTFQRGALQRGRPDLRTETARPPRTVTDVAPAEGTALIDLARGAMVTRARDLGAFQFADPEDVFVADDGDGLAFAMMGSRPARRAVLPATFAALTLKNGVPLGYIQLDVLGPTAAISFNTFETFRGAEAGHVFARLLAAVRHVFGCTAFSIEPYQLGQGNEEAIESGAWWFYYKFGFRPRARAALALVSRELRRVRRSPGHRSSAATLRRLAAWHVFLDLEPDAATTLPPIAEWGGAGASELARCQSADPGVRAAWVAVEASRRLGVTGRGEWSADERLQLERWGPLVLALARRARWPSPAWLALADVIRAKAARSERRYLESLAAHPRLTALLLRGP